MYFNITGRREKTKLISSKEINAIPEVFLKVNFYIQKCGSVFQ